MLLIKKNYLLTITNHIKWFLRALLASPEPLQGQYNEFTIYHHTELRRGEIAAISLSIAINEISDMSNFLVRVAPNQLNSFKTQAKTLALTIADITGHERIKLRRMQDYLAMGCGYTSFSHITVIAKGLPPAVTEEVLIFSSETVPVLSERICSYVNGLTFKDVKAAIVQIMGCSGSGKSSFVEFPLYTRFLVEKNKINNMVAKHVMKWHTDPNDSLRRLKDKEGVTQRAEWRKEKEPYCTDRRLTDPWEIIPFDPSGNGYIFDDIKSHVGRKGIVASISEDGMTVTGYYCGRPFCVNTLSERDVPVNDPFLLCRMWVAVAILLEGDSSLWNNFTKDWIMHFDQEIKPCKPSSTPVIPYLDECSMPPMPDSLSSMARLTSTADTTPGISITITFQNISDKALARFWSLPYMREFKQEMLHHGMKHNVAFSSLHTHEGEPSINIVERINQVTPEQEKALGSIPFYEGLSTATTYSLSACPITYVTIRDRRSFHNAVQRVEDFFTFGMTTKTSVDSLKLHGLDVERIKSPDQECGPVFEYSSVSRTNQGFEIDFIKNGTETITHTLSSAEFCTLKSIPYEIDTGSSTHTILTYREEHVRLLRKLGCIELNERGQIRLPLQLTTLGDTLFRVCHTLESELRTGTIIEHRPYA